MVDDSEAAKFGRDLEAVLQTDKLNKDDELRALLDTYAFLLAREQLMRITEEVATGLNLHWPGIWGHLEFVMSREQIFAIERETTVSNLRNGVNAVILAEVHRLRKTGHSTHNGQVTVDNITNQILAGFQADEESISESRVRRIVTDVFTAIDETHRIAKLAVPKNPATPVDKEALYGLVDKYWQVLGDDVIELIKDRYRRYGFTHKGIVPYLKERMRANSEKSAEV